MFSIQLPYQGDSNEYTQHTSIKRKSHEIVQNTIMSAAMLGTKERVRNSCGK